MRYSLTPLLRRSPQPNQATKDRQPKTPTRLPEVQVIAKLPDQQMNPGFETKDAVITDASGVGQLSPRSARISVLSKIQLMKPTRSDLPGRLPSR
jgi:hypothetical protein